MNGSKFGLIPVNKDAGHQRKKPIRFIIKEFSPIWAGEK